MRNIVIFGLLFLLCHVGVGQSLIKGQVRNAVNGKPIAFVNISLKGSKKGTTSDIDGKFKLLIPNGYKGQIVFSHVNYKKYSISYLQLNSANSKVIFLDNKTTELEELVFKAGPNPAHRIIESAITNKRINDPEKLKSYSYRSYTKQVFRMQGKSEKLDSLLDLRSRISTNDSLSLNKEDSTIIKMDSLAKIHHMFMSEAISDMKYLAPGIINEKVIASNVTGTRNPLFAATGSFYQSFGFYKDIISIFDKGFVNPISKGSINKYDFYLEDTTYYKTDTVFVISFAPKIKKKFDAVQGLVSICTKDFAIKNIIAETADTLSKMNIKVQQLYEYKDGNWFPVQLNTNVVFRDINYFGKQLVMENKRYLSDININPTLSKKEFSDIALELEDVDQKTNQQLLNENRLAPLDSLEQNTYHFWDTLDNKGMDRMSTIMEIAFTNSIPLGKIDLKLNRFLANNEYEDWRFGLGVNTNNRFSKWFSIGGYGAYGIKDEAWKYGASLSLNLHKRTNSKLEFSYSNDIQEVGKVNFFNSSQVISQQLFRALESNTFDLIESYKVSLSSRIMPFVYSQVDFSKTTKKTGYNYTFNSLGGEPRNNFTFTETSLALRYVRKENYLNLKGKRVFLDSDYPVVALKYTKGFSGLLEGEFGYNRLDFYLEYRKKHKLGTSSFFLSGGWIDSSLPFGSLFTGWGNNTSEFYAPSLFQTMDLYEFTSSKAVRLMLDHNFGNVLVNSKLMKPELVLYHNAALGDLNNKESHGEFQFKTLNKGYTEAGIGLNNLLRINYMNVGYFGVGINAFYRYGNYQLDETKDNLFFKIDFDFQF